MPDNTPRYAEAISSFSFKCLNWVVWVVTDNPYATCIEITLKKLYVVLSLQLYHVDTIVRESVDGRVNQ
ncbi:hypothetical protein DFO48_105269 [Comamonas sp. AG1104]|nr:hypothetical protein DFO48_105269 [Comamonas sp. AG1104]